MSIELVLVPLALAAFTAWRAKASADEAGRQVVAVHTRMRDGRLLEKALEEEGAAVTHQGEVMVATWARTEGRFTRDPQGIWAVHFGGDISYDGATALIAALDAAYGRQVQHEVLARLRARAPESGMEIESETVEEDRSVTLVLNLNSVGAS